MSKSIFLSADWRHLCFLNYEVDPQVLGPYLPYGTDLDFYNGKTYISIVAFMFYKTKILGFIPALFHSTFEEINLRFYVTRKDGELVKRGVVFIKEVVPKPLLAWTARTFYKENYIAMSTGHKISEGQSYQYLWGENNLNLQTENQLIISDLDSMERWITEHYWGYTKINQYKTYEYEVKHPVWDLYKVTNAHLDAKVQTLYGENFWEAFSKGPSSVFMAKGSAVTVHFPKVIK